MVGEMYTRQALYEQQEFNGLLVIGTIFVLVSIWLYVTKE